VSGFWRDVGVLAGLSCGCSVLVLMLCWVISISVIVVSVVVKMRGSSVIY